jgi:hypothetical protein
MDGVDYRPLAAQAACQNHSGKATAAMILRGILLQNCDARPWSTFGDLKDEYPAKQ